MRWICKHKKLVKLFKHRKNYPYGKNDKMRMQRKGIRKYQCIDCGEKFKPDKISLEGRKIDGEFE